MKTMQTWYDISGESYNPLWNNFLSPRNELLFKLRITLRVRWLFFKRWWGERVSLGKLLRGLRRPIVLLMVGLALPIFGFLLHWKFTHGTWMSLEEFKQLVTIEGPVDSRFLIQPILLLIGVPSAFVLWAFRDHNAKAALENQRKDINLKEFQEIQLRAGGALDEKLPTKARQTLQAAAIHQLRPFVRGEYGASFRRPAWELLKALLSTSAEEGGYVAITEWVKAGGFPAIEGERLDGRVWRNVREIRSKIAAIRPDAIATTAMALITEDVQLLFRHDLPLVGGRYDGVQLDGALLAGLRLERASFVGANLNRAHMEGTNLNEAHLQGARLFWAHMEGAFLNDAHLEGAELIGPHLEGAHLKGAHLEGTRLYWARLEGATLTKAHLKGAILLIANLDGANLSEACLEGAVLIQVRLDNKTSLTNATYDDHTRFAEDWHSLTEAEREAARKPWRDRGMIHVSEVTMD